MAEIGREFEDGRKTTVAPRFFLKPLSESARCRICDFFSKNDKDIAKRKKWLKTAHRASEAK